MYIIRETVNNQTIVKRTEDYIEAIIKVASTKGTAELYEKTDNKPAKQIGYTTKEIEQ